MATLGCMARCNPNGLGLKPALHRSQVATANPGARGASVKSETYRRMIYAKTAALVQKGATFIRKWKLRCPAAVASLDEGRDELFTFLRFPASQWKALRTS